MNYWVLLQHSVCRYRFGLSLYLWIVLTSFTHLTFSHSSVIHFSADKYGACLWGGLILYLIMRRTHLKWNAHSAQRWHRNSVFYSVFGSYIVISVAMYSLWPEVGTILSAMAIGALILISGTGLIFTRKQFKEQVTLSSVRSRNSASSAGESFISGDENSS